MQCARSTFVAAAMIALLSVSLYACGEKVASPPEPAVAQPAAPAVTQAPAAPALSADADLESRLKKTLADDPILGGLAIDVRVVDGTASLWGTVRSKSDKSKAVALVRANQHVIAVKDNLVIVSGS